MARPIQSTRRSLVAFAPPKSVPTLIVYAENIVKRMTGNSSFPSPVPALAAITAATDELLGARRVRDSFGLVHDGRP